MLRACVFAHFDRDNIVDDYVLYYLKALKSVADIIQFVSVSQLSPTCVGKIEALGVRVLLRENVGYDFMSYKLGIVALEGEQYDELLICNDSTYGPFLSLTDLFERMDRSDCDFWGITKSFELGEHVQSYFVLFKAKALADSSFHGFWRKVTVLPSKRDIIDAYEIGLSSGLLAAGMKMGSVIAQVEKPLLQRLSAALPHYWRRFCLRWREPAFYQTVLSGLLHRRRIDSNPTHMNWRPSLIKAELPFCKVDLLRDNPQRAPGTAEIIPLLVQYTNYPVGLIEAHLRRMESPS